MTNCKDKVPWIDVESKNICKLDDKDQLKNHKILLDDGLKKGDYYVQKNNDEWILVERKDGDSDFRNAINQLKSTLTQLKKQGKIVSQLIVIFNKISKTEKSMYRRNFNDKFLTSKLSPNNKQIAIDNIPLELYYTEEV